MDAGYGVTVSYERKPRAKRSWKKLTFFCSIFRKRIHVCHCGFRVASARL
jgi:hypothetical protein